jgi:predicted XRE-type DNA-binding protein
MTSGASSQSPPATVRISWLARHLPDPEDQREYARERCIVAVTEALGGAMETAGLTQSALAERLGRTRGHVSKVLNGAHNMTLRTLGDMLWACDMEVRDLELAQLGVIEAKFDDAAEWSSFTTDGSLSRSPAPNAMSHSVTGFTNAPEPTQLAGFAS